MEVTALTWVVAVAGLVITAIFEFSPDRRGHQASLRMDDQEHIWR